MKASTRVVFRCLLSLTRRLSLATQGAGETGAKLSKRVFRRRSVELKLGEQAASRRSQER